MRGARAIRAQHGLPELSELDPALVRLPRWEVALSLAVPWLCFGVYVVAGLLGWWPVAVLAVVLLSFFTYGSISHDLVHGNLGLPRRLNDLLLCITELLAVRSGHAYRLAHLHHHARFPADDDIEGAAAGMGLLRTLADGVTLQPRVWMWAMRRVRGSPVTGAAGFGTAIGVHFPIGYTALTHLAPAYLGALMFVAGLVLTYPAMKR